MSALRILTAKEVAVSLGVSFQRVYQLDTENRLPTPIRISPSSRGWREADIKRWAEREWWGSYPCRVRPVG